MQTSVLQVFKPLMGFFNQNQSIWRRKRLVSKKYKIKPLKCAKIPLKYIGFWLVLHYFDRKPIGTCEKCQNHVRASLFCKYLLFCLLIISKQRFVSKKSTLSPKFDIFYAQSISNLLRSCKNVSFLKTENEKKWLSANSKQQPAWYQARIATFLTLNAEYGEKDRRSHYVTLQR